MSTKSLSSLQQVLCRATPSQLIKCYCPSLIHTAFVSQPTSSWQHPLESRSFVASTCCWQANSASALASATSARPKEALPSTQTDQQQPAEQYSYTGRIAEPYVVKPKPVFAVVEIGPTQFKVTPDDLVYSEKLKNLDVGDKLSLNRVLLLGNTATTIIGRPVVPGASVTAIVEEQFLNGKVLIFKKRRRKNSRRLNGHRQELTGLRITEVHGVEAAS